MKIKSLLLISILFCFGCKEKTKTEVKSEIFINYLQKVHKRDITSTHHYYLIIPLGGCQHCVVLSLNNLKNIVKNPNVTAIISHNGKSDLLTNDFKNKSNILIESKSEITRFNLDVSTVTIFETKEKQIIKTYDITSLNIEDIYKKLDWID